MPLRDGGGQRSLTEGDDAAGHLVGGEANVIPEYGDDGNVDVGENIHGHVEDRQRTQNHQQKRDDGKGVRPSQREADYPHIASVSPAARGLRSGRGTRYRDAEFVHLGDATCPTQGGRQFRPIWRTQISLTPVSILSLYEGMLLKKAVRNDRRSDFPKRPREPCFLHIR